MFFEVYFGGGEEIGFAEIWAGLSGTECYFTGSWGFSRGDDYVPRLHCEDGSL